MQLEDCLTIPNIFSILSFLRHEANKYLYPTHSVRYSSCSVPFIVTLSPAAALCGTNSAFVLPVLASHLLKGHERQITCGTLPQARIDSPESHESRMITGFYFLFSQRERDAGAPMGQRRRMPARGQSPVTTVPDGTRPQNLNTHQSGSEWCADSVHHITPSPVSFKGQGERPP